MSKSNYHKIKAEIFKLSTLNKFITQPKMTTKNSLKTSRLVNDELGYFSALDNL